MSTIQVEVHAGAYSAHTIDQAIILASARDVTVMFEFNSVTIRVNGDSDTKLIYRDFKRAMSGYIPKEVGPYPTTELSSEEQARDEFIKAEKERQRAAARAERLVLARREALEAKIAGFPMSRDEGKWQEGLAVHNGQKYGLAVYRFAERWARLMEAEMAAGKAIKDVASATSYEADIGGISGFMYGWAVSVLADTWKYGETLRRWHKGE